MDLQGVGVPAVAPLLMALVLLIEVAVQEDLRPIVMQVRGVGGKDGGIGKR